MIKQTQATRDDEDWNSSLNKKVCIVVILTPNKNLVHVKNVNIIVKYQEQQIN